MYYCITVTEVAVFSSLYWCKNELKNLIIMKKSQITEKHVIHCETILEFNRILELFKLDPEFMDWNFYEGKTVIYPLENSYGAIDGYCSENSYIVIYSTKL